MPSTWKLLNIGGFIHKQIKEMSFKGHLFIYLTLFPHLFKMSYESRDF